MEDVLKPPGSLLATDCSKAVVLVWFLLNVFGVGVSCRKLYSFVVYLYVDGSGSITSVGEERANLSAVVAYLRYAMLLYYGTHWTFNIFLLDRLKNTISFSS